MGASEGTSPLGGGVSLPEIRASVTATLHARTGRRCASARVRCGDPPDPAIALEAAHRRLRASHESLLASRARVDAKYVTEVERRSEMATDAADARDAADAARRERDDAELRAKRAERATRIEREARRRDRVTFEKETRARDARAAETGAQAEALAARASRCAQETKHLQNTQRELRSALAHEQAEAETARGDAAAARSRAGEAERAAEALALALSAAAAVAEAREAEARRDAETMRRDTDDERSRLERRLEAARGEKLRACPPLNSWVNGWRKSTRAASRAPQGLWTV